MHTTCELNLDGLPGPTHHFAGLACGNLASMRHRFESSSPRRAALQGLDKMRRLHDLGIPQAICPPHERPHLGALRALGFTGRDPEVLRQARRDAPDLFHAAFSSSAMWTANAATVSPAADTRDGRLHLTPANLASQFHRAIESAFTTTLLQRIFPDPEHFTHHPPLPPSVTLRDEGAANHLRLAPHHGGPGLEVFVWGESSLGDSPRSKFPPRQTLEASQAVARHHGLTAALFLQQHPAAIDAGVFHNDVIAVANESVLLCHQSAFAAGAGAIDQIRKGFAQLGEGQLTLIEIADDDLSLEDAVATYLFNSQLVTLADGTAVLIAPEPCRDHPRAAACLERILAEDNPVARVEFIPLDQSMRNGGGPACLRLRLALGPAALASVHSGIRYDPSLDASLRSWIEKHYRDELHIEDLADPALLDESRTALDELSTLLGLGTIYPFQK